jgi:hypothetical protein
MTPIVAPELFERVVEYASEVESVKTTSPYPLDFCDNFYAQFFQNRMNRKITGFGNAAKESAIQLRLKVQTTEGQEIAQLIVGFEQYCDVRYEVFSAQYDGGNDDATSVFQNYLAKLLGNIDGWARAEKLADIERESARASSAWQRAVESLQK